MSSEAEVTTHGSITMVVVMWLALSVFAELALIFALGPHMPPGRASVEAADQTRTNIVLGAVMIPILAGLWVFFGYTLAKFAERGDDRGDGPPVIGNGRVELSWLVVTIAIVLSLAAYGTYALYNPSASVAGAGGGQGPHPTGSPPPGTLQVQVIAQQWQFTYRFPQYGGMETFNLRLPAHRTVEFSVTSLDVVHSFWAYQLGVKADAVPGANNIAYATTRSPTTFDIRCAELCGVWHGAMSAKGAVLTDTGFAHWIAAEQIRNAPSKRFLPPFAQSYFPEPTGRAG
jgi:cytochrome c oxidase subunit 2